MDKFSFIVYVHVLVIWQHFYHCNSKQIGGIEIKINTFRLFVNETFRAGLWARYPTSLVYLILGIYWTPCFDFVKVPHYTFFSFSFFFH